MGVDAHIARSPAERLAFSIRNMLLRLGITVLLCHPYRALFSSYARECEDIRTKVYYVYDVGIFASWATD